MHLRAVVCISALLVGLGGFVRFPGRFCKGSGRNIDSGHRLLVHGIGAVVGALFGLSFVYKWGEKLPRRLKLILAWFGCIGLSIWGFSFFVLKFQFAIGRVVSAPSFVEQDASPMAAWGYVWYALFLIWGHRAWFCCLFRSVLIVRIFPPLCMGDIMTKKYPNIIIVIYILYRH